MCCRVRWPGEQPGRRVQREPSLWTWPCGPSAKRGSENDTVNTVETPRGSKAGKIMFVEREKVRNERQGQKTRCAGRRHLPRHQQRIRAASGDHPGHVQPGGT